MIDIKELDKSTSDFYVALYRIEDFYAIHYVYRFDDEWFISNPIDYTLDCVNDFSDFIESNLHLFNIKKFNEKIKNDCKEYYDERGIRILDDMIVFVQRSSDEAMKTGSIVNVVEKNRDYYADYGNFGNVNISVSFNDVHTKNYVTYIPAYYLEY